MLLKKLAMLGSAVAALSLPIMASADNFVVVNNSKTNYSSASIKGLCVGSTAPGQSSSPAGPLKVRAACHIFGSGNCDADLFDDSSCGHKVAQAHLTIGSGMDASIHVHVDPLTDKYNFSKTQDTSTITIEDAPATVLGFTTR